MATDIGQLRHAGLVIESAFPAATALTDRLPFFGESFTSDMENSLAAYLDGNVGAKEGDITQKKWSGSVEGPMVYDKKHNGTFTGIDLLLAAALGTTTWDASAIPVYHQITLADELTKSITLAIEKQVSVWCLLGCFVKTLEIKGSAADGILSYAAELQPYNLDKDNATTGSPTTISEEIVYRMLYANTDFMVESAAVGAPDTDDKVSVSEFSFKLDNGLSDPEFATKDASHTDALLPLQPVRNGPRVVTLDLTLPRHTADTWQDYLESQTPLNIWIKNSSADDEEFHLKIPYTKVVSTDSSGSGGDIVRPKFSLVCYRGASYNDGAGNVNLTLTDDAGTVIPEEFAIETENERTAAIWS